MADADSEDKVLIQEVMAGLATNVKRIVRLRCAPTTAAECVH